MTTLLPLSPPLPQNLMKLLLKFTLSVVVFILCLYPNSVNGDTLGLNVQPDGQYEISMFRNTSIWRSGTPAALHSSDWLDLVLVNRTEFSSTDTAGSFEGIKLKWIANDVVFFTIFRKYDSFPAIVFEQHFPDGVPYLSLPDFEAARSLDATVFPSFQRSIFEKLGSVTWTGGAWFEQGVASLNLKGYKADIDAGSNVMLFYDQGLNTCVLSSLNNFKESLCGAVQSIHNPAGQDELVCGIAGTYGEIPSDTHHETLLYCRDQPGINDAVMDWGAFMLKYHQKTPVFEKDYNLNHLAFWTDNGAFYYYHHLPHIDYETAMEYVHKVIQQKGLPVKSFQFDSWWYHKDMINSGLVLWEPKFFVFPSGMKKMSEKIDMPLTAHNRWISCRNEYKDKYYFIAEEKFSDCRSLAIDPAFWDHIMKWSADSGITVYEQDWLVDTFYRMNVTRVQIGTYQLFLTLMNEAAVKHGIFIQYCMPTSSDVLSSVLHAAVDQIRVSNDFQPGRDQWDIGMNAMLAWSLGLAPFKDCFWSSRENIGNPRYVDPVDENSRLHALASVLSRGPVGPADKAENLNVDLIMRTCRNDGLLLHPDRPATPIDVQFKSVFAAPIPILSGDEQIWSTYSMHMHMHNELYWFSTVSIKLQKAVTLSLEEMSNGMLQSGTGKYIYYTWTGEVPDLSNVTTTSATVLFPASPSPKPVGFTYILTAPTLNSGWTVLGEVKKMVPMSMNRVTSVDVNGDGDGDAGVKVGFVGGQGELVEFAFVTPSSTVIHVECNVDLSSQVVCSGEAPSEVCVCQ